ncbi:single-stranded DNA-binding protein [Caproiciproducens faecalis]|uniref:Single-stranded DNA-binding protein n=1 Tax=Caproiciproducens faecalis TaxID=2820301 RepID=A0ABS7DSU2_9FIRM|nr:single-stranded DNA-binding protein [Caproiciproducens faecalis]MBW7573890.1 single-stranded DNA-binding protein [Caproiciproducens faecalis]
MLNVAVLMGRLVADPELRHTGSDISVTSFTIAVDRSYVKSGEDRQADFIDIVAWRSTADFVCKFFHKGQMIAVHGEIQTRTYTDKDGNKRKAFEVVADKVSFCGSKNESGGSGSGGSYQPATRAPDVPADAPQYASNNAGDFEQMPLDDDLPF